MIDNDHNCVDFSHLEAKKMPNDERLEKVKKWNSLLTGRNVLQDRDDITGYAKLQEDKAITEVMN